MMPRKIQSTMAALLASLGALGGLFLLVFLLYVPTRLDVWAQEYRESQRTGQVFPSWKPHCAELSLWVKGRQEPQSIPGAYLIGPPCILMLALGVLWLRHDRLRREVVKRKLTS